VVRELIPCELSLSYKSDVGEFADLFEEGSSELAGEYLVDDGGWIARYSKEATQTSSEVGM
jgi:hypothetical protein